MHKLLVDEYREGPEEQRLETYRHILSEEYKASRKEGLFFLQSPMDSHIELHPEARFVCTYSDKQDGYAWSKADQGMIDRNELRSENALYTIECFGDRRPLGKVRIFNPHDEVTASLWREERKRKDRVKQALQRQEDESYALKQELEKENPLFCRPALEEDSVLLKDRELVEKLDSPKLIAKEENFLFSDIENVKLEADSRELELPAWFSPEQDCYFWLEDRDGRIVSTVSCCEANRDRVFALELENYRQGALRNLGQEDRRLFAELVDRLRDRPDTNMDRIHEYLILESGAKSRSFIRGILEDRDSRQHATDGFLPGDIVYNTGKKTARFPAIQGCVLQDTGFNLEKGTVSRRHIDLSEKAELDLSAEDCHLLSVIDIYKHQRSGHLFVHNDLGYLDHNKIRLRTV